MFITGDKRSFTVRVKQVKSLLQTVYVVRLIGINEIKTRYSFRQSSFVLVCFSSRKRTMLITWNHTSWWNAYKGQNSVFCIYSFMSSQLWTISICNDVEIVSTKIHFDRKWSYYLYSMVIWNNGDNMIIKMKGKLE